MLLCCQNWTAYKWGLGDLEGEFWWGNHHIWLMTSLPDQQYELRVDLENFAGEKRYALYQSFWLASETDYYRLSVRNYTGDAGDCLVNTAHNYAINMSFSTTDADHDVDADNCAQLYSGGWWYRACHCANLNGLYLSGNHTSFADGIEWHEWTGYHYSLKATTMKIRPVNTK